MDRSMKAGFLTHFCILLAAAFGRAAVATPSKAHEVRESRYEVFSHGMKVGQVRTMCGPVVLESRKAYRFESSTSIDVHFLFFS